MYYVTGQTVGHVSTLLNCEFWYCVILLTVDDLLCLGRVICPNLETQDTVNVVASEYYILRTLRNALPCNLLIHNE